MTEEQIKIALDDLRIIFGEALNGHSLEIDFSWDISDKTISEIGGRLIEDYVLTALPKHLENQNINITGTIESCTIPSSQRSMEDISFVWSSKDIKGKLLLLVDVKGHNETKKGSRPNLASIRKCLELYSDENRVNEEVIIFFCRYIPIIVREDDKTKINYEILPDSFTESGIFLLRCLSENNLDPADIGSGGQILFARENDIVVVERTREEFVEYLYSLIDYLDELKAKKRKDNGRK